MIALGSGANLVLASEFRDGNVPARQSPLSCAQMAFQALPASIKERYFRGDSACHENTLLNWHREKAGAIEHAHSEIKNALGGGHMPSQKLAVNAAWFTIAPLAYNVASAIKTLCLDPEERTARFKRYRLLVVELAGRMSRFQCKLRLRLRADKKTIQRIQRVWKIFELPTQATAFT